MRVKKSLLVRKKNHSIFCYIFFSHLFEQWEYICAIIVTKWNWRLSARSSLSPSVGIFFEFLSCCSASVVGGKTPFLFLWHSLCTPWKTSPFSLALFLPCNLSPSVCAFYPKPEIRAFSLHCWHLGLNKCLLWGEVGCPGVCPPRQEKGDRMTPGREPLVCPHLPRTRDKEPLWLGNSSRGLCAGPAAFRF